MIEHALIDGDILCYRAGFACENETEDIARWQVSEMVRRILHDTNSMQHHVFISGSSNFRYDVYPLYKANRKDLPKPKWLQQLREQLVLEWGATIADGVEADDLMGIEQGKYDGQSIICSIDKDLLMIPGLHYNFVKQEFRTVSPLEGLRHFYFQLIMGDKADNIPGYDGKMRQKVPKFLEADVAYLEECMTEQEMYDHVYDMYTFHGNEEQMTVNGKCLWIMHKEEDYWQPLERSSMEDSGPKEDTILL